MARTLNAGLEAAIAEAGTAPGWLIHIATSTPLRYSTRGTLSYGGQTWTGGATLAGVGDTGLLSEVRLGLPNTDNAASALALTDLLRDVAVTLYAYYGNPGYETELLSDPNEWAEINVTVTDGQADPDAGTDAYALVEDTDTATHLARDASIDLQPDHTYTLALTLKAAERTRCAIRLDTLGQFNGVTQVDLSAGTILSSTYAAYGPTLTDLGDGWWRFVLTVPSGSGAVSPLVAIALQDAAGNYTYTGSGTDGIYVYDPTLRRGTAAAYAEELATLTIDAVEAITATRVTLVLATPAQAATHQPAVVLGPPLCRHIPPPGTVITWAGVRITIEE